MQFYELNMSPRGAADTCAEEEDGSPRGEAEVCLACGRAVGMLAWLPPFLVVLKLYGKTFGDFVFMGATDDILVSEKFRDVYRTNGLTGLVGFDPVEVVRVKSRRKKLAKPPTYFRVAAQYGNTALDLAASGIEWLTRPTCDLCRSATLVRWTGLIVEQSTWTGEDAFRPRGMPGATMVSERFKRACEANDITNAFFTPAEAAGHDFYPGDEDPNSLG